MAIKNYYNANNVIRGMLGPGNINPTNRPGMFAIDDGDFDETDEATAKAGGGAGRAPSLGLGSDARISSNTVRNYSTGGSSSTAFPRGAYGGKIPRGGEITSSRLFPTASQVSAQSSVRYNPYAGSRPGQSRYVSSFSPYAAVTSSPTQGQFVRNIARNSLAPTTIQGLQNQRSSRANQIQTQSLPGITEQGIGLPLALGASKAIPWALGALGLSTSLGIANQQGMLPNTIPDWLNPLAPAISLGNTLNDYYQRVLALDEDGIPTPATELNPPTGGGNQTPEPPKDPSSWEKFVESAGKASKAVGKFLSKRARSYLPKTNNVSGVIGLLVRKSPQLGFLYGTWQAGQRQKEQENNQSEAENITREGLPTTPSSPGYGE